PEERQFWRSFAFYQAEPADYAGHSGDPKSMTQQVDHSGWAIGGTRSGAVDRDDQDSMSDNEIIEAVAANVRESRKAAGLSQEELALEAEVDRTYISQVERGKRNIT